MRRFPLFFIAFVTLLSGASVNASALPLPHIVVSILGFFGPECSPAVEFKVSNQGDAEQPFGWTLTLSSKDLGTSQTFFGQQPLAAGASLVSGASVGITAPGGYHVALRARGVLGPKVDTLDRAFVRVPATCGAVTTPELLTPINNAAIPQNNPGTGCSFDPRAGFGLQTFFDWTDSSSSAGIAGYQIFAEHVGSTIPILDFFVTESEFTLTACGSFVADVNLDSWRWRVKAVDNLGNESAWTDFGFFHYEPCRIDGVPCGVS